MTETRRQSITSALRIRPMTALEISGQFGIPVKTVLVDLEHIRRSLRGREHAGQRMVVRNAECHACGFVFRDRTRLTAPSRCPRCRSERISEPAFNILGSPR